jgi:hypothetical protein
VEDTVCTSVEEASNQTPVAATRIIGVYPIDVNAHIPDAEITLQMIRQI